MSNYKNNTNQKIENKEKIKNNLNEKEIIIKYIEEIKNEKTRIRAIKNLSKYIEKNQNLAEYLWYSTGTVAAILQEIIKIYQYLSPPKLTQEKSNEACAAISLFQCLASHNEIRHKFIESKLPIFLYPFLSNIYKSNPYEYIKLRTLGVIGALVKFDDSKVISFLIDTEIFPLCLRILERGTELSKCVACFIVLRIVLNDVGFKYIFKKEKRLYFITQILGVVLKSKINHRLLKYILRIFARLSENKETRNILRNILPEEIKNDKLFCILDDSSKKWIKILKKNLEENDIVTDTKIEKLKNDLSNKNDNIKNIYIINKNNDNKTNLNNGEMVNHNNKNFNLILMNQMIQKKSINQQNCNDINYFNVNNNYINKSNYNKFK